MAATFVLQLLWRTALYIFYGGIAILVYQYVFQLPAPYAGIAAAGIVTVGLIKDLYDEYRDPGTGRLAAYKLIDHNPFNIVLIGGLFLGVYAISSAYLFWAVVVIAGADMLLDGYRDVSHRPHPYTYPVIYLFVAVGLFGIHWLYGIETVIVTVTEWGRFLIGLLGAN